MAIGTPSLVLGAGTAGVGKTTLLTTVAHETPDLSHFNIDVTREMFHIA